MLSGTAFKIVSWNETYKMLLSQSQKISENFDSEVLVGIARGGWIPARVLSDLLVNPSVASMRIECVKRSNKGKSYISLTQTLSCNVKSKNVLLVDEVSDSGSSLELAKEHVKRQGAAKIKTATLFYKPWSSLEPDFYEKKTKKWVVFPWELKETIKCIAWDNMNDAKKIMNESLKLARAGASKTLVQRFVKQICEENI